MTYIESRREDRTKQQNTQQITQHKKRNIRLGFVIPPTSTTAAVREQKKCRPVTNDEKISSKPLKKTTDLRTKRTTAITESRVSNQSQHNVIDLGEEEENDFHFDSSHTHSLSSTQRLTTDESVKRTSNVPTPRIRSDRPTTKPIHLGLYEW